MVDIKPTKYDLAAQLKFHIHVLSGQHIVVLHQQHILQSLKFSCQFMIPSNLQSQIIHQMSLAGRRQDVMNNYKNFDEATLSS